MVCLKKESAVTWDYGGPESQNTTSSNHISEHTTTFEKTQWHFRSPERKHELIRTKASDWGMKDSRRLKQEMAPNGGHALMFCTVPNKMVCLTFSMISNVSSNIESLKFFFMKSCFFLKCSLFLKMLFSEMLSCFCCDLIFNMNI